MARINYKKIKETADNISSGWETEPDAEFSGVTLAQYNAKREDVDNAENEIIQLKALLEAKENSFDDLCRDLNDTSVKIRQGVIGHKDYGEDSPLIGSMGFIRKSDRKSGLHRSPKEGGTTAK